MRLLGLPLLPLAILLAAAPGRAQPCLGLPLEPGDQTVGALVETETGYTLLAGEYAGTSRALAWRAHAGGVLRDFPGSFPGPTDPAVGLGLAWVGASRRACPMIGLEYVDAGSDRALTVATLGFGLGLSTLPDSTGALRAIIYGVPQVRWLHRSTRAGDVADTVTESEFAVEAGLIAALRRFWAGGGARIRHRPDNDYPLDAILLVRAGVRW